MFALKNFNYYNGAKFKFRLSPHGSLELDQGFCFVISGGVTIKIKKKFALWKPIDHLNLSPKWTVWPSFCPAPVHVKLFDSFWLNLLLLLFVVLWAVLVVGTYYCYWYNYWFERLLWCSATIWVCGLLNCCYFMINFFDFVGINFCRYNSCCLGDTSNKLV